MNDLPHFEHSSPDQAISADKAMPRRFGRRGFLRATGITAGLIAADTALGSSIWKDDSPQTTEIDDTRVAKSHPETAWFWLGGFGKRSSQDIAEALQPASSRSGRSFAVEYGNNGIEIEALTAALVRTCREENIRTVGLYAHSAAGITSPLIAGGLEQAGVQVPLVIHDCSPTDKFDVRNYANQYGLEFFSRLDSMTDALGRAVPGLDETDIKFGPGMRTVFEMGSRVVPMARGEMSLQEAWRQSIEKNNDNSSSNSLILSTARLIERANPWQTAQYIPPSTKVVRLQPIEHTPPLDNVINNPRAYAGMQAAMGHKLYHLYELGYSGHANPCQEPDLYNRALRIVTDTFPLS